MLKIETMQLKKKPFFTLYTFFILFFSLFHERKKNAVKEFYENYLNKVLIKKIPLKPHQTKNDWISVKLNESP